MDKGQSIKAPNAQGNAFNNLYLFFTKRV